jgi:hypothetical protein
MRDITPVPGLILGKEITVQVPNRKTNKQTTMLSHCPTRKQTAPTTLRQKNTQATIGGSIQQRANKNNRSTASPDKQHWSNGWDRAGGGGTGESLEFPTKKSSSMSLEEIIKSQGAVKYPKSQHEMLRQRFRNPTWKAELETTWENGLGQSRDVHETGPPLN